MPFRKEIDLFVGSGGFLKDWPWPSLYDNALLQARLLEHLSEKMPWRKRRDSKVPGATQLAAPIMAKRMLKGYVARWRRRRALALAAAKVKGARSPMERLRDPSQWPSACPRSDTLAPDGCIGDGCIDMSGCDMSGGGTWDLEDEDAGDVEQSMIE